jgi:glycosyltransferase involved in cell wall biosynthesis
LILGKGEQKERLIRLARDLGIIADVNFKGFVNNNELAYYLNIADIFVSCSYTESASLSMFEAMACGLPLILSNFPSNYEWVTEGENGFLFELGSYESLVEKLIMMLKSQDQWEQMGKINIKIAREKASRNRNLPRLIGLIREISR